MSVEELVMAMAEDARFGEAHILRQNGLTRDKLEQVGGGWGGCGGVGWGGGWVRGQERGPGPGARAGAALADASDPAPRGKP